MHRLLLIVFLFAISVNVTRADFSLDFSGTLDRGTLDTELRANFKNFKSQLKDHPYYQGSRNTNLVTDFVMLMTNKAQNSKVRLALDYFLKTGGPFKTRPKKATAQEKVFLAAACQIVSELDPSLAKKDYDDIWPKTDRSEALQKHLKRVLEIQGKLDVHPFRDSSTLKHEASLKLSTAEVKLNWKPFKDLLLSPDLFKAGSLNLPGDTRGLAKASFLNDIELIGFQLAAVPDIHGNYIDDLWANDNQWMEDQHNYVQWWFPIETIGMGDGIKAPRFLPSTTAILTKNPQILASVQGIMRESFSRKARFWGQKLIYERNASSVKLEKLEGDDEKWERNWIKKTHNYLRMSRFLTSLRLFGLIPERDALWEYLTAVKDKEDNADLTKSYEGYWKKAAQK